MKPSDFATREEWIAAEKALIEKMNEVNPAAEEKRIAKADQRRQNSKRIFKIDFCTFDLSAGHSLIVEWFSNFTFAKPNRMYIASSGSAKAIDRKYNKDVFEAELQNTKIKNATLKSEDFLYTKFYNSGCMISFSTGIDADLWNERKEELIDKLGNFFLRINGAFGMIRNAYDSSYVHGSFYREEELFKLDDSDYPGIKKFPHICDERGNNWRIDPSCLPGSEARIDSFTMASSPYMWIGPELMHLFPRRTFEKFKDCIDNAELSSGFRRIVLFEDIAVYNNILFRKNQWAFKKHTQFEKILNKTENYDYIMQRRDNGEDVNIEFKTGEFSHGGDLLAIYYLNKKGQACSKGIAYWQDIREMKGNDIVWHERVRMNQGQLGDGAVIYEKVEN